MLFNKRKIVLIFILTMIYLNACSNNTEPSNSSLDNFHQAINTTWRLVSIETSSDIINVEDYESLKIILLRDNNIWGYNSCNYLGGNYSIIDDHLIINAGVTEMGCPNSNFLNFGHLHKKPKIRKHSNRLFLQNTNETYVYISDFSEDISQYSFLNDTLILQRSNDFDNSFFDTLGYYPKLIINSHKEFSIQWYFKSPSEKDASKNIAGIFETKNGKDILFTKLMSSGIWDSRINYNLEFINRIIKSNAFEDRGKSIKLTNTYTNTYYEFK